MLKKLLILSSIVFVIAILTLSFINTHLTKKAPIPLIKYNSLELETVLGVYNWFDKDSGGNSNLGLSPEEGVKNIQPVVIEPNGKIYFSFDTSVAPKNISLNIWKNQEIISQKIFKNTKDDFFYVPNESGIYVYEINAEWDETHTSSSSFKIGVQ